MPKQTIAEAIRLPIGRNLTLRAGVVDKLRSAIARGHFQPGRRLIEREMCELLSVSRTLIREALRQLEAEGWVRLLPHRGPVVASMTPMQVRELYEVRGALEGLAAQLCAERISQPQLDKMQKIVDAIAAAQQSSDLVMHRRHAGLFYELLREAAGNEMLRLQLKSLNARLEWVRTVALSHPPRASLSVLEEQNLLAALRDHNPARARQLCEQHLRAAAEAVVSLLAVRQSAEASEFGSNC